MNASSQCPHNDLHINIQHIGFDDSNIQYIEIKATCRICDKPMVFQGLPLGLTPAHPTGELGGYEVRLPILAEGEELTGKILSFAGKVVS